jgi:hypothetical protein
VLRWIKEGKDSRLSDRLKFTFHKSDGTFDLVKFFIKYSICYI